MGWGRAGRGRGSCRGRIRPPPPRRAGGLRGSPRRSPRTREGGGVPSPDGGAGEMVGLGLEPGTVPSHPPPPQPPGWDPTAPRGGTPRPGSSWGTLLPPTPFPCCPPNLQTVRGIGEWAPHWGDPPTHPPKEGRAGVTFSQQWGCGASACLHLLPRQLRSCHILGPFMAVGSCQYWGPRWWVGSSCWVLSTCARSP